MNGLLQPTRGFPLAPAPPPPEEPIRDAGRCVASVPKRIHDREVAPLRPSSVPSGPCRIGAFPPCTQGQGKNRRQKVRSTMLGSALPLAPERPELNRCHQSYVYLTENRVTFSEPSCVCSMKQLITLFLLTCIFYCAFLYPSPKSLTETR